MIRLVAARAIALLGVLILFFMDHDLFLPFGLFLAFVFFFILAYLYSDFTDPKSLDDKQAYWGVIAGMLFCGFATEIIRSLKVELPTEKRIIIFCAIVIITGTYTAIDAKKKIERLESKKAG